MVIFLKLKLLFDVMYCILSVIKCCTFGVKKSSHLPSVQWDGQYGAISVLFPFNFGVVTVLVHFQTVPVLFQRQPSILVNCPDVEIKRAWSLIAQEFSVF